MCMRGCSLSNRIGGSVERNVLGARDAHADAAQHEPQAYSAVAEDVQHALPAEDHGQQHADRRGEEHVDRNGDVGRGGADGGDQHASEIINEKPAEPFDSAGFLRLESCDSYDARAVRRGAAALTTACVAGFTAFVARAVTRALAEKQRSSATSTRPSMAAADSRMTSETSEMMRNLARSSMRFSRNERLLDLARNVRLLSTSATS